MSNRLRFSTARVSIREIALAAGVSKTAATYALQNKPEVSRVTRDRVLRLAKRLGYAPDPRMAVLMAAVQAAKAKDFLPIAWLNTNREVDAWHKYKFHTPYFESAQERALKLGYRLEEIWTRQAGMTLRRISQILDQRGIEGVIVTHPARHIRLNWNRMACIAIGGAWVAPRLHCVTTDYLFNFLLAIKMLKRFGYRRIGICLDENIDRLTHQSIRAMTTYSDLISPKSKRVPPCFFSRDKAQGWWAAKKQIIAWLRRHEPDVVVGHDDRLVQYVGEAGYRVPEEIGVVHLATDDDVGDWAGIYSNKRAIGAAAVEWVISLIQNRQFGVPPAALNMTVQGRWHPGRTLQSPKTK